MRENTISTELMDSGKMRGMLTYSEINDAFLSGSLCNDELEVIALEDIPDLFHDTGVKAVDSQETITFEEEELAEHEKQDEDEDEDENTEDLIQAYFHSMGDISVLTKDEEIELAKKLEEGNRVLKAMVIAMPLYAKIEAGLDRREQEDLDNTEDAKEELSLAMELVTKAKHELIIHNLRLVVYVAKNYTGRGLSLLDLIQEGNVGLIKAIDKFDYKRGFKFSTYATWWIRQKMLRALMDQIKTIRLPVHITELYGRIIKVSSELVPNLGREPRTEEIAERLGVPVKKVDDILGAIQEPITLQTPIGDEESTLEDVIGDDSSSPYADAERNMVTEQILKVLHTMTPREEEVIRMRFGIGIDRDHTLEEVGRHLSLSRERVRQIEASAMRKLKHPQRLKALKIIDTA